MNAVPSNCRIAGAERGLPINLDMMLRAYAHGIFPMSDARDDPDTFWVEPKRRAILPLGRLHVSSSLAKTVRRGRFDRIQLGVDLGQAGGVACRTSTASRITSSPRPVSPRPLKPIVRSTTCNPSTFRQLRR